MLAGSLGLFLLSAQLAVTYLVLVVRSVVGEEWEVVLVVRVGSG